MLSKRREVKGREEERKDFPDDKATLGKRELSNGMDGMVCKGYRVKR